ncbi:MAG: molybdopterin molybdotransferase MoeA [Chloroflexi bacterium]|nr:molybdopterin molybdotransferase MoeA [Chloroflexota bacterium]
MPEFLTVLPPDEALAKLFEYLSAQPQPELIPAADSLNRVTFEAVRAPGPLPAFPRSTMDGYAVRARDTFGASQSLPAYLTIVGEVPMGRAPALDLQPAQAALIHTGGMIPAGADAVVQIELTQQTRDDEIEVLKAVAPGENILRVGDDLSEGETILPAGHWIRPQDLGGLSALGVTRLRVGRRPRVALLATGDEIVPPDSEAGPGQVRDVNSFAASGQIERAGGIPIRYGIAPDNFKQLKRAAESALAECDALVLSAGSSVSARDMTAEVIAQLGKPGVIVHGVAVKPGKPSILAVANGKPVFGLPGNPVSAMVIADLFVATTVYRLQGCAAPPAHRSVRAKITHNLPSQAGRVDYTPARLVAREGEQWAEPIFGKSNQIFTLVFADGMIITPRDSNGLSAGEVVEVRLF